MFEREPQPSEQFIDHMNEISALRNEYPDLAAAFKDMWDAFLDEEGAIGDRMLHPENAEFLDQKIKKRHNKLQRLYIELDKLYVGLGGSSLQVSPDNIYRFMQTFKGKQVMKLVDNTWVDDSKYIAADINAVRSEARKEARREVLEKLKARIDELSDQGLTKQEVLAKIVAELEAKNRE